MRYAQSGVPGLGPGIALVCLAAGCLAPGDPPLGQHLVVDRRITAVFFLPSEVEGVPSTLVASGPVRQAALSDESVVDLFKLDYPSSVSAWDGLASGSPAVKDLVLDNSNGNPTSYIPHTDSRGRLVYLTPAETESDASINVARVDFGTLERQVLGPRLASNPGFLMSDKRSRIFAGSSLVELDSVTEIDQLTVGRPAFIGEDFYYGLDSSGDAAAAGKSLNRRKPGAAPEVLLTSTAPLKFVVIRGDLAPQLLVYWVNPSGDVPSSVFDTQRLASARVPLQLNQAQYLSASSDGHCLLFAEVLSDGANRLYVFDWTTGRIDQVDSASFAVSREPEWRPGAEELWFSSEPRGLGIWNPTLAQPQIDPNTMVVRLSRAPELRDSMFTRDGHHWFSVQVRSLGETGDPGTAVEQTMFVGSVDDGAAPLIQLYPEGADFHALWETSDGRLLVGASTFDENRQDIYLIDPDTGSSRGIASGGRLVALGKTRALALLGWQPATSTGDLSLIDLATGSARVLAQDVYYVAVDPGFSAAVSPETDRLAPGTAIAFLSRNRLVAPYDGLWVARLP
jgi:hypothetical protein